VGHGESNPIPPFAKTAKSGAPAKSKTQLRNGIARGSDVSCDTEDARKGGPPAALRPGGVRGMPKTPFALGSPGGILQFERYFAQEVLP